jgi:GNAT superfamily N-acetyltransferase
MDGFKPMTIRYELSPPVSNEALNTLFAAAWENHTESDFAPILSRSLVYVCAYDTDRLIGFVNVAWDGGIHAFLLDTTVHPDVQRRGIATELVSQAAAAAKARGIEWLHVDFEPHLLQFYRGCGFQPTEAGLMHLKTR